MLKPECRRFPSLYNPTLVAQEGRRREVRRLGGLGCVGEWMGSLLGPLNYVEDQHGNKGLGKAGSYLHPLLPELFQMICHIVVVESRTGSSTSSIRMGLGIGLRVGGA